MIKALFLLLAALAFAAAPFFSPFDGFDPNLYPVPQEDPPVQPAGYAFAIWGPIYIGLILHAGFGLLKRKDDPAWDAVRLPLIISLVIGAPWLMVASQNPPAATAMIWAMLLAALWAFFKTTNRQDRWVLQTPVAVYAGWLSAASFVSVGLMLAGYGIVAEETAALIALALAIVFAFIIQDRTHRAPEYGATVVWALVAVMVANWGGSTPILALCGAGIIALVFSWGRSS
ncbi:hypothetical protein [Cognatishimia sp. MH4019]|uniref:hypothetical protein n=1 Tax=Cognatishimia sp. MH4019 TaxID=2854030 RepID=UPI001CD3E02C|nr:hypothetical protein [Cognatishimia sp. MH4019]